MSVEFHAADPGECRNFERLVTVRFRRVFGDSDDRAHRCYEWDSYRRISHGSAAGVDVPVPELTSPGHHGNDHELAADGGHDRERGQLTVGGWLVLMVVLGALVDHLHERDEREDSPMSSLGAAENRGDR